MTTTRVTDFAQLAVGDTVRFDDGTFDYTVTAVTDRRADLNADLSTDGHYRSSYRVYSEYDMAYGHLFKVAR